MIVLQAETIPSQIYNTTQTAPCLKPHMETLSEVIRTSDTAVFNI